MEWKEEEEDEKLPERNYESLNGLRGFGSVAVFLHHFVVEYFPPRDGQEDHNTDPNEQPSWLKYCRMTPLVVFVNGYFWVAVFFILSGFVLPLSYFKTGKNSSLWGGTFRRYPRLMIPVLYTITFYYSVTKFGVVS